MIKKFIKRLKENGWRKTSLYYGKIFAWKMSPNYRQNPSRFKFWHSAALVAFLLYDYIRLILDRVISFADRILVGRKELDESSLEEFEIRLLRRDLLNKDSIIYAFGVSRHIETEEKLAERIDCKVYLFDPTPPAIEFMQSRAPDPKLIFSPIGIWVKNGPIKFYVDRHKLMRNFSVVNIYGTADYLEAECYTLPDIMKMNGHPHLDVLKMDIEGSALPVLLHMLEHTNIRPVQIVGALERPHIFYNGSTIEIIRVMARKAKLFRMLSKEGYRIITHHAAEFTAVRLERGKKV